MLAVRATRNNPTVVAVILSLLATLILVGLDRNVKAGTVSVVIQTNTTQDISDTTPDGVCGTNNTRRRPGGSPSTVVTGDDCSLREAIQESNAWQANHPTSTTLFIIRLMTGATHNLTLNGADENAGATGDLDISHDHLTIEPGPAAPGRPAGDPEETIVDGSGLGGDCVNPDRVFHILPAGASPPADELVTFENFVIQNGQARTAQCSRRQPARGRA